jgi:hypothetical protein
VRRKNKRTERSKLDATPPWETRARPAPEPTKGPYDVRDAPEDDLERVDLGALQIPLHHGMEVRLELNEAQQVVAVTLVCPDGHMQLGVFAAPRSEGIWDDVRAEIAASLHAQRGTAKERLDGPFGVELVGRAPGDGNALVPVRFIGVDGPRWMLRAMLVGRIATDAAKAEAFEQVMRDVVVVRGADPLPVREAVPLTLPKGIELPGGESGDPFGGDGAGIDGYDER